MLTCYPPRLFFLDWCSLTTLTMLPLPNFVLRGQFDSGEFRASQRYPFLLLGMFIISSLQSREQGIYREYPVQASAPTVHSLVIHLEDLEADLVTTDRTDSVIYSPRPYPTTPSSFKSSNSQQSYIKQHCCPAFRIPASPPRSIAPHWNRLVSSSLG